MIKKSLFTLLILCICTITFSSCTKSIDDKLKDLEKEKLAFEKKVALIKNDSLKQQAQALGGMLFWFQEIDLKNQKMPTDTAYAENPFLILEDYPSLTELGNNYLNGIIIEKSDSGSDKTELKVHYPFAFPFQRKTNWSSVQFSDKTSTAIAEDFNDSIVNRQVDKTNWNNEEGFDIYYPTGKSQAIPITLNGTIETQLPKNILKFEFAHNETGDTKEQSGIKVKLVSIKGHAVSVEIVNPHKTDPAVDSENAEFFKVLATDKTKKYLDSNGYSNGPDDLITVYQDLLNKIVENPENAKALQLEMEKEQDKNEEKHKNTSYSRVYFSGTVEDVVVYVMDYSKASILKRQIALPVHAFKNKDREYGTTEPFESIFEIPTTATVYDREMTNYLNGKPELQEEDLAKQIKIEQSTMNVTGPSGKTQENLTFTFQYPQTLSSNFVANSQRYEALKEIAFYEKKDGKKIDIPKTSIDYNNGNFESAEDPWVELRSDAVEFNPAKFPTKAKYAKGVVQVRLAEIKKITIPVTRLTPGIKVIGNKVIIDNTVIKNKSFIYAKDKTGKYLKRITSVTYPRADNQTITVDYYYGTPYTLEYYEQTGEKLVNYQFEVNLKEQEKKKKEGL